MFFKQLTNIIFIDLNFQSILKEKVSKSSKYVYLQQNSTQQCSQIFVVGSFLLSK